VTDEELFAAVRAGDLAAVTTAIDAAPQRLYAREQPYGWSLLHAAAHKTQLAIVDFLLQRGLDANTREQGDNTTAMHWAAAAGGVDVVRRLIEAGCDVVGYGDDHALEVIGWASCWDGCDDDAHRAVVDLLLENGARHHIFSAVAMNMTDEVRRIVAASPGALSQTLSKNEHFELPLQFAVRKNNVEMVHLLIELGADVTSTDSSGANPAAYAAWRRVDQEVVRALFDAGLRTVFTSLAVGDDAGAEAILKADPRAAAREGSLHMLAKRGEASAAAWLLDRGGDPNARWDHWDADVTALHMAVLEDNADVVRLLLGRGADPTIRDSMHDSDALGWAEYLGRPAILEILKGRKAE
jgi:ankyrin repeat protein